MAKTEAKNKKTSKKARAEDINEQDVAQAEAAEQTEAEVKPKKAKSCKKEKAASEEPETAASETEAAAAEPAEEADAKYLRLMADFQNYKRRAEKEKSDIYAYASEKLVVQLLDVIDNFDRAVAQAEGNEATKNFAEGMELILKQLQDVLDKNGVKEIEALGQAFDPNFHNAVMMEDTDQFESGQVSAVLQKGYTLNGKVVRPAMVKVAN